jgi:hypothetical protein
MCAGYALIWPLCRRYSGANLLRISSVLGLIKTIFLSSLFKAQYSRRTLGYLLPLGLAGIK